MLIAFDVISDLNLDDSTPFNWTDKPTSLFCVIAGNISSNLPTIQKTLLHLSKLYHGVFFIDGYLENKDAIDRDQRIKELKKLCIGLQNVVYLHNNVVVVDGVALVGINGWYKNYDEGNLMDEFYAKCFRYEDADYLGKTIEKLQLHADVKKIVVISNSVPCKELYFGECSDEDEDIYPNHILDNDTEGKVQRWVYSTYGKIVDTTLDNVNYVTNGKFDRDPYYAKRIEILI